ncbi:peptidoglycan-binding protein [Candidatus Kaiserbacteria bacterium]|nr:peptidoglycan-binding protein [Candidatus Kaiserbacteria bacterium]
MRTIYFSAPVAILFACALTFVPQAVFAANATVTIGDNYFQKQVLDIAPGDTVTWLNDGKVSHTVTADNNSFDSGPIVPGNAYMLTFTQLGEYRYYDKTLGAINGQGMAGAVRVLSSLVQTPVPTQTTVQTTVPNPYAGTNTTTTTSVSNQAQALLAQVVQLQQLLATLRGGTSSGTVSPGVTYSSTCPNFGRILKPGMSGTDVTQLQQFLASDRSVYPEGTISGYYGSLTEAAVQRWQIKYSIVSSGDSASTGFGQVGPRTASAMMLRCSSGSTGTTGTGGTSGTPDVVDGFMQVTPVTGNAPLTVSVQTTINSLGSCSIALFTLDWGDGTAPQSIPLSVNACAPLQQTYTHTYTYGGSYVVRLSSGGHQSTATLLINGPQAPTVATTTTPTIKITSPALGQNINAGQTVPITWSTSGTIPAGAALVLDLYDGVGNKISSSDVIAISSYLAGSISWTVPTEASAQACPSVYPSGLCGVKLSTGSYKIHATLYASSAGVSSLSGLLASADSGVFTIIVPATPDVPNETFAAEPTTGTAPLSVKFEGTVNSKDKGWCATGCFDLLSYGDGGSDYVALPITLNSSLPYSFTHTYQSAGTYTATLYQGQTVNANKVGVPILVTVTGTQTDNYAYAVPTPAYAVGGNPLSVSETFDLPTSCTGFQLSWGDGSSDIVQTHSTNCAQAPVSRTYTHQYGQSGSYDITLKRGASLSRTDVSSIVISN